MVLSSYIFRNGLEVSSSPVIVNSTTQAQLVFQNTTLIFNDSHGFCTDCSFDIVILVHTELLTEVSDHAELVNATADYSTASVVVSGAHLLPIHFCFSY